MTDDQARVSTTDRVVRVLLAFADEGGGDGGAGTGCAGARALGVSAIARRLDLSKAVVHRILQSLVESGFLVTDDHLYSLGPASHALARQTARHSDLLTAAVPLVSRLAAITGETAILSARVGYRRVYVHQVESDQPVRITITPGRAHPLSVGANGLAILAFLAPDDVEEVLHLPVPHFTERTVTDPDQIRGRLARIRDHRWATTSGERVPLSTSIAAPVLDGGVPAGSLSVGFLATRISDRRFDETAALVRDAGEEASQRFSALIHQWP